MRLHIGGDQPKEGWKVLNIQPGPHVDFVGDATDLGSFAERSVDEVYVSHVLEHVPFAAIAGALGHLHRILKPAGRLMVSVPDLAILCRLYVDPALKGSERFLVMQMIYGGHLHAFDVHHAGYDEDAFRALLAQAGFRRIRRVEEFGLFEDSSIQCCAGRRISLNMVAHKSSV